MKTLKTILFGLMIIATCGAAKANDKPAARLSKNFAINAYVDAISLGHIDGVGDIVDNSAKFSMVRGEKVVSFSKAEMMTYLKQIKGVEQRCKISTAEVESTDNVTVIKVDMKYDNFTRSNYVTLANTGDGWKITNVHSVFK
jgi:hypothetical protein